MKKISYIIIFLFIMFLTGCELLEEIELNTDGVKTTSTTEVRTTTTTTGQTTQPQPEIVADFELTYEVNSSLPSWIEVMKLKYYDDSSVTVISIKSNNVKMNQVGTYDVYVNVKVEEEYEIRRVKVNVVDIVAPELSGISNKVLGKGGSLRPLLFGVKAIDNYDGDITLDMSHIDMSGLNRNEEGIYTVTYQVSDSSGNQVTASIEVEVIAMTKENSFQNVLFESALEVGNNDVLKGNTHQLNPVTIYKTKIEEASMMNVKSGFPAWIYIYVEDSENNFVNLGGDWESHNLYVGAENRYVYLVVFSSYETEYNISLKTTPVDTQNTIQFVDSQLENAIKDALNIVDFEISEGIALIPTKLDLSMKNITNLSGIEQFINVNYLYLNDNQISDLTPLVTLFTNNNHYVYVNLRNNLLNQQSYSDLKSLENKGVNFEFDMTPDYFDEQVVLVSDTPSGIIEDKWQRDVYKLENVNNQLIHIQLLSPQYDYNFVNISFDLYTYKDGEYIPLQSIDYNNVGDLRFGLVYSTYENLYISVKAYGKTEYSLQFTSEAIDPTSPIVNLDGDLNMRVYYQIFGETKVPITKQMVNNLNVLFLWHQSLQNLEYFHDVEYLTLDGCNVSDLTILNDFTNLKFLDLSNNGISDISHLADLYMNGKLDNLEKLVLTGNSISSEDEHVQYLVSKGIDVVTTNN